MGLVAYRSREASSGHVSRWLRFCLVLLAGRPGTPSRRNVSGRRRHRPVWAAVAVVAASLWAGGLRAQTFVSEGPGPRIGQIQNVQSGDSSPNGTGAGAIQAILPDPMLGANTYFVGSPNGGVWVTNNGGATWTPLTDKQSSLSITSLALDPTDPTGKTIIAGIGATDNGEYSQFNLTHGQSGALTGLLYTTNGGMTWSNLGGTTLAGQSVVGVEARGNVILAATFEDFATSTTAGYGLFRSTDGGATFTRVSGSSGLRNGAVTSLVADPTDPSRFYAAVKAGGNAGSTSVYMSTNNGAIWSSIFTASNSNGLISTTGDKTTITLAAGPNGSVAIAITDLGRPNVIPSLAGVFLSGDNGTNWHQLTTAPNVIPGGQSPVNLHIAIDPTNGNIVYLTGDAYQSCANSPPTSACTVEAFRLTYNPATDTSSKASLTFEGTPANNFSDANTVHADSRAIAFDQAGNLILGTDGGIYLRANPQGNGAWQGLNNNLTVLEPYAIAYDANSHRLAVAAQDGGVSVQNVPNNPVYTVIQTGDGTNVAINDRTHPGLSAIYSTSENFANFSRMVVNAQGQVVGPYDAVANAAGTYITCNGGQNCDSVIGAASTPTNSGSFSAPLVLNRINPSLIAIGGLTDVYTTQDTLSTASVNAHTLDFALTDMGTTDGPSVITYGTVNDVHAIAVGAAVNGVNSGGAGEVWFSGTSAAGSLHQLNQYVGDVPTSMVFDNRIETRLFVADATNLYYSQNVGTGGTFSALTLPAGFTRPTSVEFISSNGVNALFVGGLNTPLTCTPAPNGCVISNTQSPVIVADSDTIGNLSAFRAFGQGLPNTLVYQMVYNPTADVLSVASIGRGAWLLYDVTSNFAQATVLQFGLGDNDSNPDVSLLTNGTVGVRPLIKYGAGTLTIAGDATYTGGTTVNGGTLVLGAGGASGSVIGNIAFCSDASDASCDPSTNKRLVFNRSDVFTFGGSITGPGQVLQAGSGTLILSGQSGYAGPTNVDAGTLAVTGSITSPVFVNSGAALSGSGTVGSTTINAGGLLAPVNPGGALTVQGNLAFASAGAYLVQIADAGSDRVNVTGSATLAGNVFAALSASIVQKQYTILTATGGVAGTFAGVNNLPAALPGNLSYDADNVFLNLSLNYNALGSLNSNQQNVANALSNFFNSNGSIPLSYALLTPATLSQIAGESATGSQQTTFQAMTQFITTLLDPFIGGRETAPATTPSANYAAEDNGVSAYAAIGRAQSQDERAAYAAVFTKAPLRQIYDPHWSVWASPFAGSQTTDGNAVTGSNSATSRIFGMAAGADYLLSPRTIAGFALAGGGTNFSVANSGTGRSDLFQTGVFVRHNAGAAYVSAALAYGWQDVTTDRMVMADKLHAEFNANALSGRVEGGYRFASPWFGITPYAAGQFTTFFLPAYVESAVFGSNAFALGYGSQSLTDTRTELGFRTDRSFALATGLLTLRSRFAWAHDYDPDRAIAATFQALPGASFVVNGAAQASESALTTVSAEMKWRNGWSASATFEGEFSKVTASYAGKGVVRYAW
jgi:autotransporter-associated beta strand protein